MTELPVLHASTIGEESQASPLGRLEVVGGHLPLVGLDVAADITGLSAGTRVRQVFRNTTAVALEATYIFPLPDRAAVTSFTARIGERIVEGVLRERGEARREYDEALAAGHRAAIAEQERSDVFTVRVGNIAPGETAEIDLALAGPVALDGGEATYRFPLVVAPRYIPGADLDGEPVGDGTAADTDVVPDASRISPPVLLPGQGSPVRLSLTCRIDPAGLQVHDLASSLHTVTTETGADGTRHISVQPGERLDRDFILRYRVGAEAVQTTATLSPDADGTGGTLAVTIVPPAIDPSAPLTPRDVVIALDRSGSMGGWKIVAARRAAARIVDSLQSADRVAVVAFDHEIDRPSGDVGQLRRATDRQRFAAIEYLAGLDARGGTEMYQALHEAALLFGNRAPTRRRVLLLVTDGQVGDEDRLVSRLARELTGVDTHVVGIDQAVGGGLLTRLVGLGTGAGHPELVESEDRLDAALARVRDRITAPVLTDVSLHVDGADLVDGSLVPAGHVGCAAGVPLVLRARLDAVGQSPVRVRVEGRTAAGRPWAASVEAARTTSDTASGALWAREHLRHLEDQWLTDRTRRADQDEDLVARMVAESLRFSVLCRFTAFVAVDRTDSVGDGRPLSVVQPVEAPHGWDTSPNGGFVARLFAAAAVHHSPGRATAYDAAVVLAGPLPDGGRASLADEFDRLEELLDEVERAARRRRVGKLKELASELRSETFAHRTADADPDLALLLDRLRVLADILVAVVQLGRNAAARRTFTETIPEALRRAREALSAVLVG